MFLPIRKFRKRVIANPFILRKKIVRLRFKLNSREISQETKKSCKQYILFYIRIRLRDIMFTNYKLPMQKISTTPKKTDLNSERLRLEKSLQMQPKVATQQKILQFASAYRAEPVNENQYVEWYLN